MNTLSVRYARGLAAGAAAVLIGATTSTPVPIEARGKVKTDRVSVGTHVDLRLQSRLHSGSARPSDRVEATSVADVKDRKRVVIPAGAVFRGVVTEVDKAGRLDRRGSLGLRFESMTVQGRTYDIRANVVQDIEGSKAEEVGKVGAGAGVGAIVGGILGGSKGAITGAAVGAGGMVLGTNGSDVDLPAGSVLRVRFDTPVDVERAR